MFEMNAPACDPWFLLSTSSLSNRVCFEPALIIGSTANTNPGSSRKIISTQFFTDKIRHRGDLRAFLGQFHAPHNLRPVKSQLQPPFLPYLKQLGTISHNGPCSQPLSLKLAHPHRAAFVFLGEYFSDCICPSGISTPTLQPTASIHTQNFAFDQFASARNTMHNLLITSTCMSLQGMLPLRICCLDNL